MIELVTTIRRVLAAIYAFVIPTGVLNRPWSTGDLKIRLELAIPPTVLTLLATIIVTELAERPVFFGALASSAYLIYQRPNDLRANLRSILLSYFVALLIGVGAGRLLTTGFLAGAVAMSLTIAVLVTLECLHAPALGMALGFGMLDEWDKTDDLFLIAVFTLLALAVIERRLSKHFYQAAALAQRNRGPFFPLSENRDSTSG